jgi:tRNA (guanine-N7-)-methyltransferase
VETFYLLFPDPWPKRRHWRRRIVTPDLLKAISQALIQGGILLIATDNLNYFEKIKEIERANSDFAAVDFPDIDLPHTNFERKFRAQDAAIYRLELRKLSPVR